MAIFAQEETDWRFRFHAGHKRPVCIDPADLITFAHHTPIEPSSPRDPLESVSFLPLRSDTTTFPTPSNTAPANNTPPRLFTLPVSSSYDSPDTSRSSHSPEIIFDTVQSASSRRCSTTLTHVSPNSSTSFASPIATPRSPRRIPRLLPQNPGSCPFKNCQWSPVGGSTTCRSSVAQHITKYHKHRCERGCENVGFQTLRDRDRHHNSGIHRQSNQVDHLYRCGGCGHLEHRRDNHLRHLGTCSPTSFESTYVCGLCDLDSDTNRDGHHTHVRHCKKQRGRKKTNLTLCPIDTDTHES